MRFPFDVCDGRDNFHHVMFECLLNLQNTGTAGSQERTNWSEAGPQIDEKAESIILEKIYFVTLVNIWIRINWLVIQIAVKNILFCKIFWALCRALSLLKLRIGFCKALDMSLTTTHLQPQTEILCLGSYAMFVFSFKAFFSSKLFLFF